MRQAIWYSKQPTLSFSTGQTRVIASVGATRTRWRTNDMIHYLCRAGHTIVPGTVPVGSILYHGAITGPHIPTALDWVAMEPEHSLVFCTGTAETGCWHATFAVTRPMKVLYFDGSSAAKLPEGTADTQDLVAWSEMKPDWLLNDPQRIYDLCEWGLKYGVNGFVRF